MPDVILPFDHYGSPAELDGLVEGFDRCECVLCTSYRQELERHSGVPPHGNLPHGFRCPCNACLITTRSYHRLLAAANKRDTYSELCWIAHSMPWGERFLAWAADRIVNDDWAKSSSGSSNYWWTHTGEQRTIGEWLEEWIDSDSKSESAISAARLLRGY